MTVVEAIYTRLVVITDMRSFVLDVSYICNNHLKAHYFKQHCS